MSSSSSLPIVQPLPASLSSEQAFLRLCDKPHCLFLDSALRHKTLGRYSFLTADPYEVINANAGGSERLNEITTMWTNTASRYRDDLPPFQGGAAGVLSYELGECYEELPKPRHDEFMFPQICLGLYDVVIAFDHELQKTWLISQGFPETTPDAQIARALSRRDQFLEWLEAPIAESVSSKPDNTFESPIEITASHALVDERRDLYSNFSADQYQSAVQRAVDLIHAGDVFQVNLSQRLLRRVTDSSVRLYLRLRSRTPATFGGYFNGGDWQVISASPERYMQVRDRHVESRPIKGTRKQFQKPEADLYSGAELLANDKDRAENVMIVDLLRNDISRVCKRDSIHVPQLCGLETYGYVQHLVSAVCGTLRDDATAIDLIEASFPGGSITGAPKVRAMEIIQEIEGVARGAYCGSLGYLDWSGGMDLSILIRTITQKAGWWQMPVGGGIVADSQPAAELEETWHKAAGMLSAIEA